MHQQPRQMPLILASSLLFSTVKHVAGRCAVGYLAGLASGAAAALGAVGALCRRRRPVVVAGKLFRGN